MHGLYNNDRILSRKYNWRFCYDYQAIHALRNDYGSISDLAHTEDAPIYITKNGEGDLVIMSIDAMSAGKKF